MLDLSTVTVTDYTPVPEGEYALTCTGAEVKDTKAGDGKYISGIFTIIGGKYENRKVFQNFNVENKNPKAVEIAYQDLKKFLLSAKIDQTAMRFKSSYELAQFMLSKTGVAKVVIEDDRNAIKFWKYQATTTTTQTTTTTAETPTASAAAKALGF